MNGTWKKRVLLVCFLFLLLLAYFIGRDMVKEKTYTLMPEETIRQVEEGKGLFVFYEYAPRLFEGEDLGQVSFDESKRYRPMSNLAPLGEGLAQKGKLLLTALERQEEEKKSEGKKKGEGSKREEEGEQAKRFKTSFSLRPNSSPHAYPLLGDSQPVDDLQSQGRQWEQEYLQEVLAQKRILSGPYGRVIRSLDGYENLLSPALLMELLPGDLLGLSLNVGSFPGLKFVEDRIFYLALDLQATKDGFAPKIGEEVDLALEDGTELSGQLNAIRTQGQNRLYIFSLRRGYDQVKDHRYQNIKALGEEKSVFRIDSRCLMGEGSEAYCYKLNSRNQASKVSVTIVQMEGKSALVENTDAKKTGELLPYDRVLYHPQKVKEGEMY